jgi:hypothetical protein
LTTIHQTVTAWPGSSLLVCSENEMPLSGPGQGGAADFDRWDGEQGDVAGGLGGGAGPAEGDGGQQPDNGKGNKQPFASQEASFHGVDRI